MMLARGPKVNKIPRSLSNAQHHVPIHSGNASVATSNFDDIPLPKGIGAEGGPATFEELLIRSLAKENGSQSGDIGGPNRSLPRPTITQHSPISKSAQRPGVPASITRTSSTSSNEPENRLSMSFRSVRSSSEYEDSSRMSYEAKNQVKPLPFTSPEAARTQQPRAYELIGSRLDQTRDEELEEFQHLEQQLMNESAMGRQFLMQQLPPQKSSAVAHAPASAASFRQFNLESHDGGEGAAEKFQRPPLRAAVVAASNLSNGIRRPATAAPSLRSQASAPAIRTVASAPIESASSDDEADSAATGSDLVSKMWGKQRRKALQGQVIALKEQITAANLHRKELEQRCASLEDDGAAVKAELMRAKRAVKDLEQQREQLSSNREDVGSLVASARKEIEAEKIAEVRKAKKLQEAAEHRARVSDIAMGELKQQVQTLTSQLDEAKAGNRDRESRLKGSADSLKSQFEVLRQRNEELQKQLQIAESQLLANTHHAVNKSAVNASASRSNSRHVEPAAAAPSSPSNANSKNTSSGFQESFRPSSSHGASDNDEQRVPSLKSSSAINTTITNVVSKSGQQPGQDDQEREITHADGKRELHRRDGGKTILFPSGHRKEIKTDGSTEVFFGNGDVKKTLPDGVVIYTYGETKTIHTTHPNGLSVIEFPNGQVEKHLPDGSQEIVFPDQTFKYISPGGEEQAVFRNGTVITLFRDGRKETEFSNGQKETLYPDGTKERAYPDGSVRVLRVDGSTRSTYPDGSYRVKDGSGRIIEQSGDPSDGGQLLQP